MATTLTSLQARIETQLRNKDMGLELTDNATAAGEVASRLVVPRRSGPGVEHDDTIEVHWLSPLHHLLRRPLGELAATDPNTAEDNASGAHVSPAVCDLLDLFGACLQDRRAAGRTVLETR